MLCFVSVIPLPFFWFDFCVNLDISWWKWYSGGFDLAIDLFGMGVFSIHITPARFNYKITHFFGSPQGPLSSSLSSVCSG